MHGGAAELFGGDDLVGDGLHHVGAGDEHVAGVLHHEDEVGHGRRIDVAAGAGAHDDGDLRDHARGEHVAAEHVGIAGERGDALLDAGAARVIEADDGRPRLHRHVLQFRDLQRVGLGQRAAEHGKVLGEHKGLAAVDGAPAGDDAVAGASCSSPCRTRWSDARRTCRISSNDPLSSKQLDALARRQLAAGVLRLDALLPAAELGAGTTIFKGVEDVLHLLPPVLQPKTTFAGGSNTAFCGPGSGFRQRRAAWMPQKRKSCKDLQPDFAWGRNDGRDSKTGTETGAETGPETGAVTGGVKLLPAPGGPHAVRRAWSCSTPPGTAPGWSLPCCSSSPT